MGQLNETGQSTKDCISRQAALDMEFSNGISEDGVLYVPYREVKMNLEELPSAQPERKTGKWIDENRKQYREAEIAEFARVDAMMRGEAYGVESW